MKKKVVVFALLAILIFSDIRHARALYAPPDPSLATIESNSENYNLRADNDLVWYQPSNNGVAGSMLPDYGDLFEADTESQWSYARSRTSVITLFDMRITAQQNASGGNFIPNKLVPFLTRNNMKLAIDTGYATGASCRTLEERTNHINSNIAIVSAVEAAGGRVDFIQMESVFDVYIVYGNCSNYSFALRENDINWYVTTMKANFPNGQMVNGRPRNIKYGITDAALEQRDSVLQEMYGIRGVTNSLDLYAEIVEYQNSHNKNLDFLMFDNYVTALFEFSGALPDVNTSFTEMSTAVNLLKANGIKTGVLIVDGLAAPPFTVSERDYADHVLWYVNNILSNEIAIDYWGIYWWFPIPDYELPEIVSSQLQATQYHNTRILKILSRRILGQKKNTFLPAVPNGLAVN